MKLVTATAMSLAGLLMVNKYIDQKSKPRPKAKGKKKAA